MIINLRETYQQSSRLVNGKKMQITKNGCIIIQMLDF